MHPENLHEKYGCFNNSCEQNVRFFDAVDKLSRMNVDINEEVLSILLLFSLPGTFLVTIATHDKFPNAKTLKVNIMKEYDLRREKTVNQTSTDALPVKSTFHNNFNSKGINPDK